MLWTLEARPKSQQEEIFFFQNGGISNYYNAIMPNLCLTNFFIIFSECDSLPTANQFWELSTADRGLLHISVWTELFILYGIVIFIVDKFTVFNF